MTKINPSGYSNLIVASVTEIQSGWGIGQDADWTYIDTNSDTVYSCDQISLEDLWSMCEQHPNDAYTVVYANNITASCRYFVFKNLRDVTKEIAALASQGKYADISFAYNNNPYVLKTYQPSIPVEPEDNGGSPVE